MLASLFGNPNLERILLFLFVNERCYGTQIQSLLQVPLTPIQKALGRLEKGGIVISRYEGKIRIYELNPAYPFRHELEALLKKAYSLLPVQEKKRYCFIHKPHLKLNDEYLRDRNRKEELLTFWEKLPRIRQLSFFAKSQQAIRTGKAEVTITQPSKREILFHEKGLWLRNDLPDTSFHNVFRWTLDLNTGLISLEHLRYGPERPVFLFHLAPAKPGTLESVDSHLCAEDTYLGNIILQPSGFNFHWRIIGPHKNDELIYRYT
ncbi:MAG TPA: DUF6314 family protein [Chlamydiales bacterium]|nr:DUF6314 family protein [Chlamydiales bacterium]